MVKNSPFSFVKPMGNVLLLLAIVVELIVFPSWVNFVGCLMTTVCWLFFSKYGLSLVLIRQHIFAWLIFLSMSMYRILPLYVTLVEGKPISYGFQVPYRTFFGETFLYILSLLAFLAAIRRRRYNTKVHRWLNKFDYYDNIPDAAIWVVGSIGFGAQLYVSLVHVSIGDVFGKLIAAFPFFQNAPILLFFPSLYKKNCNEVFNNNKFLWLYLILIIIFSMATNSRQAMMDPIGTFALLLMLTYARNYRQAAKVLSKYMLLFVLSSFFIVPFLSDISLAMLSVRDIRSSVSPIEMIKNTIHVYMDEGRMRVLHLQKDNARANKGAGDYDEGWTEDYVDNYALNRYCNLRITDATLYYKERIGNANPQMFKNFNQSALKLLPTPLLHSLHINLDKSNIYSPGDFLYSLATKAPIASSMRVTSHLSDGLATFGYFYFPIQFFLFWLCFLAVDCFSVKTVSGVKYSIFGLISIFSFMAMFRNANGCFGEVYYLLRGFPQYLLLSWIGIKVSIFMVRKRTLR